jgi:hypothetical protein
MPKNEKIPKNFGPAAAYNSFFPKNFVEFCEKCQVFSEKFRFYSKNYQLLGIKKERRITSSLLSFYFSER